MFSLMNCAPGVVVASLRPAPFQPLPGAKDAPGVSEEGHDLQVGHVTHQLLQLTHPEADGLGELDRQSPAGVLHDLGARAEVVLDVALPHHQRRAHVIVTPVVLQDPTHAFTEGPYRYGVRVGLG